MRVERPNCTFFMFLEGAKCRAKGKELAVSIEQIRLEKAGDVVKRQIADEIILVPVRKTAEELDSIYSVNPIAGDIWELVDGQRTLADIKKALLDKYDVSPAELEKDLMEFIGQLKSENLIKGM